MKYIHTYDAFTLNESTTIGLILPSNVTPKYYRDNDHFIKLGQPKSTWVFDKDTVFHRGIDATSYIENNLYTGRLQTWTNDLKTAIIYSNGGIVVSAYLDMKKPFVMNHYGDINLSYLLKFWSEKEIREAFKEAQILEYLEKDEYGDFTGDCDEVIGTKSDVDLESYETPTFGLIDSHLFPQMLKSIGCDSVICWGWDDCWEYRALDISQINIIDKKQTGV